MALWQLVNLGTRCVVTHCKIALWSHQSAQTASNEQYITQIVNVSLWDSWTVHHLNYIYILVQVMYMYHFIHDKMLIFLQYQNFEQKKKILYKSPFHFEIGVHAYTPQIGELPTSQQHIYIYIHIFLFAKLTISCSGNYPWIWKRERC